MSTHQPYRDNGLDQVYNLLFCDDIDLYRTAVQSKEYPWDVLLAEQPSVDALKKVTHDTKLEARQRLLAHRLLHAAESPSSTKELLGVVIEVALEDGPDTLAAFSDGTARYINHSGKLIIWESPNTESDELIENLVAASETVVQQIGKWDEPRRPFPATGMVRLNFLVSDGLYFGEGPFEVLQSDPMGGPVINAAVQLMSYLVNQQ